MRKDLSLTSIMDRYRYVSLGAATLAAGALGLTVYALRGMDGEMVPILAALITAWIGVLAVLGYGYASLRRAVRMAEDNKRQMLDSAHRDALTGAYSRSFFFNQLRETLRHGFGSPVGYMQIDMDHLKALNDGNGHATGDAALVHLMRTLEAQAPGAIIGRLGGDEFGIAFPGHENRAALCRLGAQILEKLAAPTNIAGRVTALSATIGIAMAPSDACDLEQLIFNADLALYKGKKAGRGTVVAFDPDMLGDERRARLIERELRAAVLLNELDLHYQPIFEADGTTLKAMESLVRWQHKVRGTIMPGEFIAIAEQSDLIDRLGEWVLRRACRDLDRLGAPAVNINVSALQLRRPEFAARFAGILAEAGVEGRRIVVEVTESVPLTAGATEKVNLEALRRLGVRIAIDDFGAGHASLAYLRGFRFDMIKIDRAYVANLPHSRIDTMLVAAICRIGRALGVDVVAEGVETLDQQEALRAAGCSGLQGYLLGRPAPLAKRGRVAYAA